jgi:hypothetical protein
MPTKKFLFNSTPGDDEAISDEIINLILTAQGVSPQISGGCVITERDTLDTNGFLFAVNLKAIDQLPQDLQDAILLIYQHLRE